MQTAIFLSLPTFYQVSQYRGVSTSVIRLKIFGLCDGLIAMHKFEIWSVSELAVWRIFKYMPSRNHSDKSIEKYFTQTNRIVPDILASGMC